MQVFARAVLGLAVALSMGCRTSEKPSARAVSTTAIEPAPSGWDRTVEQFTSEYFQQRPDTAVNAGRHEFDGLLPDWSSAGIAKYVAFLKAWREKAQAHAVSGDREAFEKSYLLAQIDSDLFWVEVAEAPFTNPYYYSSFNGVDPNVYLTREYAPLDVRLRAFTKYLKNGSSTFSVDGREWGF